MLPAQLDAYRAAAAARKLTARVVAALEWQPEAGEEQLDGLVEQRRTASVGRLRAGATLAFGSDWSVSTPDPLALIEVAVNRVAPDDRAGEPFLPVERLDLPAALDAATIGAAYANRLDATTGSIEPGKLADLAVLDRDLFDPGPARSATPGSSPPSSRARSSTP